MAGFRTLKEDTIVWKKLRNRHHIWDNKYFLAEMLLPAGTRCFGDNPAEGNYGKCRANQAVPIAFYTIDTRQRPEIVDHSSTTEAVIHSPWGGRSGFTTYRLGKVIKPHEFSLKYDRCAGGIHFFFRPDEAIKWMR